jgi:catecholate siderophore receptor
MEQDNVPTYGIPWVPAGNIDPVLSNYINQAPPVDYANFYGLEDYDFEDIRNDIVTATIEHDAGDSLTLRNLSRYGDTYRRHAITAPRFADIDPGTPGNQTTTVVNRQLQQRELEHDIFANVTDVTAELFTGRIAHAVVAGFEVSYEDQDNRNSAQNTNQPQTDIYNPTSDDSPFGPMPGITGVPNEANALTLAPYLFDTIHLSERWELSGACATITSSPITRPGRPRWKPRTTCSAGGPGSSSSRGRTEAFTRAPALRSFPPSPRATPVWF